MNSNANIEKHSNKRIFFGTVLGYVNLVLSIVAGLLFTPWIINSLSKSIYGLYSLSNSLIALFVFDFGLSMTINAFLSRMRAKGQTEEISKFLSVVYKIFILLDFVLLIVFAVVYFLIDYIYVGLLPTERDQFRIIFLITACFSLISFPCSSFNGVLQAFEEYPFAKLVECINKLLYIVLSAAVIILGYGVYGLVLVNCFAGLIAIVLKFLNIRFKCKVRTKFFSRVDWKYARTIIAYSLWAALNALAARLIFNVMPSILGIVSDSTNITLFSAGASIEGYVYTFGSILGGFFLPKISRLKEKQNAREEIDKLAVKVGKIQLFLIGLIVIGFLCCGYEFIIIWMRYDTSFAVSYFGTILIISTQIIFVPQLIFYTEVFTGKALKKLAMISITKAIINLILSFILGYYLGALGAFVSIFIARLFEVSAQNVLYKKVLGANLKKYFKEVYGPFALTFIVTIVVGLSAHFALMDAVNIVNFLKIGILVTITYIVFAWITAYSDADKKNLLSLITRRK